MRTRRHQYSFIPLATVFLGILFLAYPVIATLWNNYEAKIVADEYAEHTNHHSEQLRSKKLNEARHYNATRSTKILEDPYHDAATDHEKTPEYQKYLQLLKDTTQALAVVSIPKINVKLPVYHGTDHATLQRAAGHMYGSDLPVGGMNRHAVITAHTGLAQASMFDHLTHLRKGDKFFITVQGENLLYQVSNIAVVDPHDSTLLVRKPNQDLVTLLTCTPYGVNSHRLLVTGQRILPNPIQTPRTGTQWSWWMLPFALAILIALFIIMMMLTSEARQQYHPHHL